VASPSEVVRRFFEAFKARERDVAESMLADDFSFSSPHDPELDRAGYFERCWPNMEHMRSIELDRMVESGEEVFIRYHVTRHSGERFRNAELIRTNGDRIERVEVYYGPDL
jgi:hypothetical protein